MSKEKQIEEMILTVKNAVCDNAVIDLNEDIITLNGNDLDHVAEQTAEALYNAGYRKKQTIPYGCQQCSYKQSENVIELPCKVGDKIYQTDGTKIYESTINEITLTTHKTIFVTENVAFDETAIGEGIFLTQKEAERALKGGAE